jgi:hypothetical protein
VSKTSAKAKASSLASASLRSILDKVSDSLGLLELTLAQVQVNGADIVDQAARLRAIKAKVEALDKLVSGLVKDAIPDNASTIDGEYMTAVLIEFVRLGLDTERVKKFLGVRLPEYQTAQTVTTLSFKPKA